MRVRLEMTIARAEMPARLSVGDEVEVRCKARIYSLATEQIDVSGYGSAEPKFIDGEMTVQIEALAGDLFKSDRTDDAA